MKRNVNFFTMVISLLLLSSVILAGCMYIIASDNGEMKPYDLNVQKKNSNGLGGNVVEDAPTAQLPLMSKFSKYVHEEGNMVTVFTEEQYSELKSVRENGKRVPLSYEEVLYLIDDSINLYFTYDKICLNNADTDDFLPLNLTFSVIQNSGSCIIEPYHGDFSEFLKYEDALARYDNMIDEIYTLIYYRIYMHDAGFTDIARDLNDVIVPAARLSFYEDLEYLNTDLLTNIYQMLSIDSSTVGGTENGDKLASEFQKVVEFDPNKKNQSLDAPILFTETWHNTRQFYICDRNSLRQIIYPTKELTAMKPQYAVTYQADNEGKPKPIVYLNYLNGDARISDGREFSFSIPGRFSLKDGVLKVYSGESESNSKYQYVFHETDEGFVFSAANSKIDDSIGCIWHDGLVFKKYQEQTILNSEIFPPCVNYNKEADYVYEERAYLKYDSNSDYCILASSGGSTLIAEGSYVKDNDNLIFMFKTADGVYTYYFHYRKDRVYVFDKELSENVPSFAFEDKMEFILTEYVGGSCFLEVKGD